MIYMLKKSYFFLDFKIIESSLKEINRKKTDFVEHYLFLRHFDFNFGTTNYDCF
jgi:hypothetical protein